MLFKGALTGPSSVDRGRTGSKHHLIVDPSGIPLAVTLTGGHRHDVTQLLPLVDSVGPVDGLRVLDVEIAEDDSIQPFRLTMNVTCEVEAPTEWDARTDARSWLLKEVEAGELPTAESLIANAADD